MTIDKTVVAQPSSGAMLLVAEGVQAGARFSLSGKSTIIGRDPSVDISLPDDVQCSRQHARILSLSGHFVIEDLGSTNGAPM
ncbi:MAG: FHA domain-containing protein [Chloroflexi bacterium]|nr:FHA domain-containing protein [Chloroflexota bacterium]